VSEIIPGEPERDREAEFENGGDDDIRSGHIDDAGEPGTRHSDQPVSPTTPGTGEGPEGS
jgi:hypothetical protein